MTLSGIAIIISSIAVIISGLTFYYHFLLKAKITLEYSNDGDYIVEGQIDGKNYKWIRIKVLCTNKYFDVSANNLRLKMLLVEKFDKDKKQWIELKPINIFYLRWVIDNGANSVTYSGNLARFEPQYFNLATLVDDNKNKLLYPGIQNQGNVVGWKPEDWFKEGCFRYTVGVYGDNIKPCKQKTNDYKICIKFSNDNVTFLDDCKI